jgi:hypothetical protein
MTKGVKIGQIQWLLFFASFVEPNLFFVWIISLFMGNKDD